MIFSGAAVKQLMFVSDVWSVPAAPTGASKTMNSNDGIHVPKVSDSTVDRIMSMDVLPSSSMGQPKHLTCRSGKFGDEGGDLKEVEDDGRNSGTNRMDIDIDAVGDDDRNSGTNRMIIDIDAVEDVDRNSGTNRMDIDAGPGFRGIDNDVVEIFCVKRFGRLSILDDGIEGSSSSHMQVDDEDDESVIYDQYISRSCTVIRSSARIYMTRSLAVSLIKRTRSGRQY